MTTALTALEVERALLTKPRLPPESFASAPGYGMYAWWDEAGALAEFWPADFAVVDLVRPLYVGEAAKGSLAERGVAMHLASTRMSSLRRSLASLLADELDLLPGARAHLKMKFSLDDGPERRLTDWMKAHLTVTTVEHPEPDAVEAVVIASILAPLNDEFAHHGLYWREMRASRKAMHQRIAAKQQRHGRG